MISVGAIAAEVPQTTPEGMELVKQSQHRITYAMPGATLKQYKRFALIDCHVAFAKNWDRDYNRDVELSRQVSPDDMEKIKTNLAAEFRRVFTEELTAAGHEESDYTGEDVLLIRPAIVNLEISAPDVGAAAFTHTVVRSAGQMTLYMELFDSTTGAIIARVTDVEQSDYGRGRDASRATNKSEADKMIRGWARELSEHLGEVKERTGVDE